jgi:hypothetical protein
MLIIDDKDSMFIEVYKIQLNNIVTVYYKSSFISTSKFLIVT